MPSKEEIDAALEEERAFVLALGGSALELAGGRLVTHERIPAPRFNFVQELALRRERSTAFFERALDHYFQRALRPTFRVPEPADEQLDRTLRGLGFVRRREPLRLFLSTARPPDAFAEAIHAAPARPEELDAVVAFWAEEREREELRRAIHVVWEHPNPDEELVPVLATAEGVPVSAALAYRHRAMVGIHAVATRTEARGRGAASEVVCEVRRRFGPAGPTAILWSDHPRSEDRFRSLGFEPARSFAVFELPVDAELALRPAGPPSPPRWRPPRRDPPSGSGDAGKRTIPSPLERGGDVADDREGIGRRSGPKLSGRAA